MFRFSKSRRLIVIAAGVMGYQRFDKALLHFKVGKTETVESGLRVAGHQLAIRKVGKVHAVAFQTQHGMLVPIPLQPHDIQTLEQTPLSLKIGFQRGDQKTLSETSRPRQKEITPPAVG